MNRVEQVFSDRKALIPYITAGDPDLKTTEELLLTLDKSGADIIEVGVPYSDPLADGPVIQAAGQRALKSGTTLAGIMEMLFRLKGHLKSPLLLMGYYNCILQYGKERFIEDAIKVGLSGVILPDLPFDQDEDFYQRLKCKGLVGILMTTPVTSECRLKEIAKRSSGFLYCVSLLGVTGDRKGPLQEIKSYLERVRQYVNIPLALGFGIDGPDKVREVREFVDGVIIGSALIKIIARYNDNPEQMLTEVASFIKNLKVAL